MDGAIVSVDFLASPADGDLSIGLFQNSVGRVVVSGRGSLLRLGDDLHIGHNPSGSEGSGTLVIEDEGFVIATNDAATGTDAITVGLHGRIELAGGRLRGEVISNNGTIAGDGRIDNEETIVNLAAGRVEVGSGQRLVINGGPSGGVGFDNDGEVAVAGGQLEFFGQFLSSDAAAALTLQNGVVYFPNTDFGFDSVSGVLASTAGVNDIYGTVRVQGAASRIVVAGESTAVFHGPVTSSGGTIEVFPGSTAVYLQGLTVAGNSTLSVHLADPLHDPDFGAVEVAGAAALSGAVQIQLAGGFVPAMGDTFEILSAAGGITGSLSLASAPALPAGLEWNLDVNATSVLLSVVPALDADFDGDVADLTRWTNNFGLASSAAHAQGDADADLDVDGADFLAWQQQLGSNPATAATTAVPEPAALLLVTAVLICPKVCATERRRRANRQSAPSRPDGRRWA